MKKTIFLAVLTIVATLLVVGCDDDCPSCPAEIDTVYLDQEYLIFLDGVIMLNPGALCEIDGLAYGGAIPDIDSFAVGDSVSTYIFPTIWWGQSDPYFYMRWEEDETPPYKYASGDLATVTVWGDGGSSSASVVIMDWQADGSEMLVPSGSDTTVAPGLDMEFAWAKVDLAEWYGLELSCTHDTGTGEFHRNYFYYTYDTVFTVPSSIDGLPVVECWFAAQPTTGPDPESAIGNWEGDLVAGKMYSLSQPAIAIVYFEAPTGGKPVALSRTPEWVPSAREILSGVIATYR